ncbi:tol-pal system protein YbgF [Phycisphaerae bacterium RAS1]|nr:tol-pal system protein YbgF [Phycisphaerae bacterium RAS1]
MSKPRFFTRATITGIAPLVCLLAAGCFVGRAGAQQPETGQRPVPQESQTGVPRESQGELQSYLAGNGLLTRGMYDLAAEEYRKFLSGHAAHEKAPVARYGLAVCLFRTSKLDAAEQELKKLADLRAFTYAVEVQVMLGQCRMAEKDYAAAAGAFERAAAADEKHELADDAAALRIESLHRGGRHADAISASASFASRWPESPLRERAAFFAGLSAAEAGDWPAAERHLSQVLERSGDSPLAEQAAFWHARCALQRGDARAAAERCEAALRKYPKSSLAPEIAYDRAAALHQLGELEAAGKAVAAFLRDNPQHPLAADATYLAALCAHQQKQYDASSELCQKLIKSAGDSPLTAKAMFLLGENSFLSDRNAEAARTFEDFLKRYAADAQAPRAKLRLGMALQRLGKHDEAQMLLAQAAELAGKDAALSAATLELANACFDRQEWQKAADLLEAHLARDGAPDAAAARLKLGLAKQRLGRTADALPLFDAVAKDAEADAGLRLHARFERGQCLLLLDRADDAAADLEAVRGESKDESLRAAAARHLATIAMRRGDYEKAAGLLESAGDAGGPPDAAAAVLAQRGQALLGAKQYDDAARCFSEFLKRFETHELAPRARVDLGIALSRAGKTEDALAALQAAERSADALDAAGRTLLLYEQAWCLRSLKRPDDAIKAYARALSSGGAGDLAARAAIELAGLHAEARRFDEAAKLLGPVCEKLDEHKSLAAELRDEARYRLGVCQFELGKPADAAATFSKLISERPDSPLSLSARFFAGEAYARGGKHEKAVECLAVLADQDAPAETLGPALLRLGESLAALQRWPRSEEALARYLKLFPDSEQWFTARFGVGWARENQQRFDEAISAYRDVAARHQGPTAARAQFQIGECLFALKQHEDAVRELLKVDILYAYPEWSAAALFEAGRCFEALGKNGDARTQYKQVAEKHGKTRWGEMAQQRLAATASAPPGHAAGSGSK